MITEGLTEYEVDSHAVKLTLLRAFGSLSKDDTGVRGSHAGPPLGTPEGQCLNRLSVCRYAWLPCEDAEVSRLYLEADLFYGAVYGQNFSPMPRYLPATKFEQSAHQLIALDNPNVHLTAIHPVPNGWRLRIMNPSEQAQSVTISGAFPQSAQLKKQLHFGEYESLSSLTLSIPPKFVVSLAIII